MTCADARNSRKRALARQAGIPEREASVDAADAATRIAAWRARGYSLRKIAQLTGVGRSTVSAIAARTDERSSRSRIAYATLTAILAIGMPDGEVRLSPVDRGEVPDGR